MCVRVCVNRARHRVVDDGQAAAGRWRGWTLAIRQLAGPMGCRSSQLAPSESSLPPALTPRPDENAAVDTLADLLAVGDV